MLFFFFKQKTAYEMRISDWSSDVCSSDLHDRRRQHKWRRRWAKPQTASEPREPENKDANGGRAEHAGFDDQFQPVIVQVVHVSRAYQGWVLEPGIEGRQRA